MLSQDGIVSWRGVSWASGGNPTFLLRALENALTVSIPAVVELALIFVCPLLHDVERAMDRAARPVHEEGLVRLKRLVLLQPADRVVGEVFAEVVALLHGLWRQDVCRVADQVWLILRGLACEETVEVFEAEACGPVLERAGGGSFLRRRVVPLAPGTCGIAIILQHLCHQCTAPGNAAGIAIPVIRQLRDLPVPYPVMIASGQQ